MTNKGLLNKKELKTFLDNWLRKDKNSVTQGDYKDGYRDAIKDVKELYYGTD